MLKHRVCYLFKRALVLCVTIGIFLILLPNAYISKGVGDSFGIAIERYTSTLPVSRFNGRIDLLQESCKTANLSQVPPPKTLLYSKKLNLVYCPVPLTSSTQLKHAMLKGEGKPLKLQRMYNLSTHQAIHSEAQTMNLKHSILQKTETLSKGNQHILVVSRNPWQRLATAYYDMSAQKKIYRTKCAKYKDSFTRELSFDGFLHCLLHYANGTQSLHNLDSRLSPISTICSLCRVPYTVIANYETADADLYDIFPPKKSSQYETFLTNYHDTVVKINQPSADEIDGYLKSLDQGLVDKVEQLYQQDFIYFGYSKLRNDGDL